MQKLEERTDIFMISSTVHGKLILRFAIGSELCTEDHVKKAYLILDELSNF